MFEYVLLYMVAKHRFDIKVWQDDIIWAWPYGFGYELRGPLDQV